MTRVDFYLLSGGSNAVAAACRLCEKAAQAGQRLYVHAPDAGLGDELDGALWSFRQGGFVAHERYTGATLEEPLPPVLIGREAPPDSHRAVLMNLGAEIPTWFSSFDRVLEVVAEDAALREKSRERFRYYRERGYPLNTFEQTAEGGWKSRA